MGLFTGTQMQLSVTHHKNGQDDAVSPKFYFNLNYRASQIV